MGHLVGQPHGHVAIAAVAPVAAVSPCRAPVPHVVVPARMRLGGKCGHGVGGDGA